MLVKAWFAIPHPEPGHAQPALVPSGAIPLADASVPFVDALVPSAESPLTRATHMRILTESTPGGWIDPALGLAAPARGVQARFPSPGSQALRPAFI